VDAKSFAGTTTQQLAVNRAGAAAIDALFLLSPEVDAFDARIALDQAFDIISGVMGNRLDGNVIARIHLDLRLEELAEIAPVHRVSIGRQVMVSRLARFGLSRSWRRKRAATPGYSRAATSKKCAFEKTAPLSIKVIEELLLMEHKVRTTLVISSAHCRTSLFPEVAFLMILLAQMFALFARCGKVVGSPIESRKLELC
jgi:hypothetical protein